MNALVPYIAALHQQDLLQQAEVQRRAKLSSGSQPSTPAWRRTLSGVLASAAQTLDPSVLVEHSTPLPSGRGVDALPAS